ncbi:MAG: hypothetical protein PHQ23_10895 [Candidatus Wallbacteria bacterium]|nr:hypothetical protein [Candidatus Wallbacteria bacterium]
MGKHRIPKDNQEFIGFIKQFANALSEKNRDDKVLADGGKELLADLQKFVALDEKAREHDVAKKKANEEKYTVKDGIVEKTGGYMFYLKYKLGKSAAELKEYNI